LLEDAKPGIELKNTELAVAEELSLERNPCLMSGLHRFPNNLVEFRREGAEDPCHHDVVQPSPIGGRIDDIEEDVVVQGIAMKCEKHEVMPSLMVWR
jgi:hypothetical protein